MSTYDRWLEKPYQDRAAKDDLFVKWCEDNDLDPSEVDWDDFEQAMEDAREDAMVEAAEMRKEMEMERMAEMDYDDV